MSRINELLIPNVTGLPQEQNSSNTNKLQPGQQSEFADLIGKASQEKKAGVELSTHAQKRLQERNISFDGQEYLKLQEAMGRLKAKGGHDSLVITGKAAYVLDVDRGMVVTAVDRDSMSENVFTKIDSTIFMN
jgi:flagellar operon protein